LTQGRRELINEMAIRTAGTIPQATVVFEDRGSWIAAAQAGMGSFLSYRCVLADHEGIEIRPFTPPQAVPSGSFIEISNSPWLPRGSSIWYG
jgi:hypothetical protein